MQSFLVLTIAARKGGFPARSDLQQTTRTLLPAQEIRYAKPDLHLAKGKALRTLHHLIHFLWEPVQHSEAL